jgi:hypothetical protein
MMKIGAEKSMAYFALANLPFILVLILPALKSDHPTDNETWYI